MAQFGFPLERARHTTGIGRTDAVVLEHVQEMHADERVQVALADDRFAHGDVLGWKRDGAMTMAPPAAFVGSRWNPCRWFSIRLFRPCPTLCRSTLTYALAPSG